MKLRAGTITLSRAALRLAAVRAVVVFAVLAAVVGGIVAAAFWREAESKRTLLEVNESDHVELQGEVIAGDFKSVVSDLAVLVESRTVRAALDDPSPENRQALADEFSLLIQAKGIYDQVRLLNAGGQEVVRVNYVQDAAAVVPLERLQYMGNQYYFSGTFDLQRGQVFVSPFDLNMEYGEIEQPYKPTIRFGTPAFDGRGEKRGIVILNYLGRELIAKLRRAEVNSPGQIMLLNPEGYWLAGPRLERNWAFMFADRKDDNLATLEPELWAAIASADSGQLVREDNLYTFETVYPMEQFQSARTTLRYDALPFGRALSAQTYHWKIVSHVPRLQLAAQLRQPAEVIWPLALGLTAVVAAVSWFIARNSVAQQQITAALRQNEERFRQLAETIDEVFWIASADGRRFEYVSPAFAQIWGRSPSTLKDSPTLWASAIHPDDQAKREAAWRQLADEGAFDVEYRLSLPDGGVRWVNDRGFAMRDSRGAILRVAGIAADITLLKQAEQQVLQNERLAAIGEAMTGLAHESRNALQRSQAGLEMLVRRASGQPDSLELIAEIQQAQNYLHGLYEEVRGYASPLHPRCRPADLRAILNETWDHLGVERNGRPARMIEEEGSPPDATCEVDVQAVQQVLRNILENALAAAPREAEIRVRWSAADLDGRPALRCAISDNGPGLTPEQQRRIFDPFYTTKARGTGLGMAITRRIVDAHGGRIAAGGEPGRGATIEIVLPRHA